MTLFVFNSTTDRAGAQIRMNTLDQVQIGMNGYVYTSDSLVPIVGSTTSTLNDLSISVQGTLVGYVQALQLGSVAFPARYTAIRVAATGVIDGSDTIAIYGTNTTIINQGQITGQESALLLSGADAGQTTIVNTGVIAGQRESTILVQEGTLEAIHIENRGIIGSSVATRAFQSTDTTLSVNVFRNAGLVLGDVQLGGGADTYDGRGGEVLGTVMGGAGNDLFVPGDSVEILSGGDGNDGLDLRNTNGATVALDGSLTATDHRRWRYPDLDREPVRLAHPGPISCVATGRRTGWWAMVATTSCAAWRGWTVWKAGWVPTTCWAAPAMTSSSFAAPSRAAT